MRLCDDSGKNIIKQQSRIESIICLHTIQRIKNAIVFCIHVNTYFYIELEYSFSAIDT